MGNSVYWDRNTTPIDVINHATENNRWQEGRGRRSPTPHRLIFVPLSRRCEQKIGLLLLGTFMLQMEWSFYTVSLLLSSLHSVVIFSLLDAVFLRFLNTESPPLICYFFLFMFEPRASCAFKPNNVLEKKATNSHRASRKSAFLHYFAGPDALRFIEGKKGKNLFGPQEIFCIGVHFAGSLRQRQSFLIWCSFLLWEHLQQCAFVFLKYCLRIALVSRFNKLYRGNRSFLNGVIPPLMMLAGCEKMSSASHLFKPSWMRFHQ